MLIMNINSLTMALFSKLRGLFRPKATDHEGCRKYGYLQCTFPSWSPSLVKPQKPPHQVLIHKPVRGRSQCYKPVHVFRRLPRSALNLCLQDWQHLRKLKCHCKRSLPCKCLLPKDWRQSWTKVHRLSEAWQNKLLSCSRARGTGVACQAMAAPKFEARKNNDN